MKIQNNAESATLSSCLAIVETHPKFDIFIELEIALHLLEHVKQSLNVINDDKLSFSCERFMKQVNEKLKLVLTEEK